MTLARPLPLLRAPRGRGFTLLELMVVIAIIGLLGTMVAINVSERLVHARQRTVHADMQQIDNAIKLFRLQYHRVPRSLDELVSPPPIGGRSAEAFLERAPIDPWDRLYTYEVRGSSFDVVTLGSDGEPSGEGEALDIRWSEVKAALKRS